MEAPFWRAKGWETDAYKDDHRGFHHSNLEMCFRFLFIYVYYLQMFWFLIVITLFMIVCSNLVLFLLFWLYIPWLFDSQFFFFHLSGISIPNRHSLDTWPIWSVEVGIFHILICLLEDSSVGNFTRFKTLAWENLVEALEHTETELQSTRENNIKHGSSRDKIRAVDYPIIYPMGSLLLYNMHII